MREWFAAVRRDALRPLERAEDVESKFVHRVDRARGRSRGAVGANPPIRSARRRRAFRFMRTSVVVAVLAVAVFRPGYGRVSRTKRIPPRLFFLW